ncbi:hypothetical protein V8C26DRAFT_229805 [Trichoderma gracile]
MLRSGGRSLFSLFGYGLFALSVVLHTAWLCTPFNFIAGLERTPLCFHFTALKFVAFLVFWSNCQDGALYKPMYSTQHVQHHEKQKKETESGSLGGFCQNTISFGVCLKLLTNFLSFWVFVDATERNSFPKLDTNGKNQVTRLQHFGMLTVRVEGFCFLYLGQDWNIRALLPDTFLILLLLSSFLMKT